MFSPTPSDISLNNTEMLEEQCHEMQQQHKEEQWFLIQLKDAAKSRQAECVA